MLRRTYDHISAVQDCSGGSCVVFTNQAYSRGASALCIYAHEIVVTNITNARSCVKFAIAQLNRALESILIPHACDGVTKNNWSFLLAEHISLIVAAIWATNRARLMLLHEALSQLYLADLFANAADWFLFFLSLRDQPPRTILICCMLYFICC